jgi:DNA (cytosine-5)-methyltransferase 1
MSPPSTKLRAWGTRPILIDLYCCQGGAGRGYVDAGFDVIGVDKEPQPRYPFPFIQADVLKLLQSIIDHAGAFFPAPHFVAFHASPPCQDSSDLRHRTGKRYPQLIPPTRELLDQIGKPYVIENVEGAPLIDPVTLCGANDDHFPELRVIRHREFEANFPLVGVDCPRDEHGRVDHPLVFTHDKRKAHYGKLDQNTSYVQVTGGGNSTIVNKRLAMGTPWMSGKGCNEAIPPAYARHVGRQLLEHLGLADQIAAA